MGTAGVRCARVTGGCCSWIGAWAWLFALLSVFATSIACAATISVSPTAVTAGEGVTVSWSDISAPAATDWYAIHHAQANEGSGWYSANTNGAASGSAPFHIESHLAAGTYEFRLFNDAGALLATSNTFTINAGPNSTTLAASPTSVAPGATLTATWQRILNPTVMDWIGLYTPAAPDGSPILWLYTNSTTVNGSLGISLPANLAPGTYQLRAFGNDTFVRIATSNSFTVTGTAPSSPTVSSSPSTVQAGASVNLTWGGISAPNAGDWMALYQSAAADDTPLYSTNTTGASSGSMPFEIASHLGAGSYQFRLFSGATQAKLATGNTFTITAGPDSTTLAASPTSVAPGGSITATWQRIVNPSPLDRIGVYTPGAGDNSQVLTVLTDGTASGNRQIALPSNLAPGTYELRLFWNDTSVRVATSNTFTVTGTLPTTPTLSSSPTSLQAGAWVNLTWGGVANPTPNDWIALYPIGADDTTWWNSTTTTGASSGSVPFELPSHLAAGSYQFRLFANDTYTKLADGNTFTVTAGPNSTSLTSTPSTVAPGATLTATWARVQSPTADDWIAIFAPNAADGTYAGRVSTNGSANGSIALTVPSNLAPGTYQLRMFWNNTFLRVATSSSFTVGSGAAAASIYFIHADHLNTPRVITNSASQAVWRWDNLDPFGANAANENPSGLGSFTCNLRLPGQYFDRETNLHYNYFRDYDPGIGRYIQADPIGLRGGLNLYAYVDNDPVRKSDPRGLIPQGADPECFRRGECKCATPECAAGLPPTRGGNELCCSPEFSSDCVPPFGAAPECRECLRRPNPRSPACILCGREIAELVICSAKHCKLVPRGTCRTQSNICPVNVADAQ